MWTILVVYFLVYVSGQELLMNPGFENPNFSGNWDSPNGWGFKVTSVSTSVYSGHKAMKVSERKHVYEGPGQKIALQPGERYKFQAYVSLLNNHAGKTFQSISVDIAFHWPNGSDTYYKIIAYRPFLTSKSGWMEVQGDFMTPSTHYSSAVLYFQGPDPGINFLIDAATLQHLPKKELSRSEQNSRINKYRKSDITFTVDVPQGINHRDIVLNVEHKRHLFGFGSLVDDHYIVNPDYKQYQNLFYYMFNWATIGTFKWKFNRGTRDHPNYDDALRSMKEVKKRGMKVRGHNMFWDVPGYSPSWVEHLSGPQFKSAVQKRINYMTGITRGQLDQWDINNEALHGQMYEDRSGDADYTEKIYNMVHTADPHVKLMLNDFGIVSNGVATKAYVEQANKFQKDGVSLYGLGIQSHFGDQPPDPTLINRRLDLTATAGLPLWITELDINNADEHVRADWYETLLRAYFAHPDVEGVIFWGFWDITTGNHKSALVNGYDYYVNAAGRRYMDLIKKEWTTNVSHPLSAGTTFQLRGFQGDYDITVTYKGKPVLLEHLSVGKSSSNVHIKLDAMHTVQLPSTVDPFAHVTHPVHLNTARGHVIGHHSSSMLTSGVSCVNRWSPPSQIGDDKSVSVHCQADEVLTGCSSILKTNQWYRDGEQIKYDKGQMSCVAVNGRLSTGPIQAVARCCKVKGLECEYRQSVQSAPTLDGQSQTTCTDNYLPIGCSSYTWDSMMDGAYPDMKHRRCVAENDGVNVGTWSFGICCHAPEMTCKVKWSGDNDRLQGNQTGVTCDTGETAMACSAFSQDARSAGAYIGGEWCIAINGENRYPGEKGVVAAATCCKQGKSTDPQIIG